jgi:hypothetical protein
MESISYENLPDRGSRGCIAAWSDTLSYVERLFGRRRRYTCDLWSCLDFDAMTGSVVDAGTPERDPGIDGDRRRWKAAELLRH